MFERIANVFRGFLGLFVKDLELQNPEAVIESIRQDLEDDRKSYNDALASHAAHCEKLMDEVKKYEKEEATLLEKVTIQLKTGDKTAAGKSALQLKRVREHLNVSREQGEDADKTYKELIKTRDNAIEVAERKISELERSIEDMEMKKKVADLKETAAGMSNEVSNAGETLDRLQKMIEEETHKASGRARVAGDSLNSSDLEKIEAEEKAMEDIALADFAAEAGIALDSGDSEPAVEKEM